MPLEIVASAASILSSVGTAMDNAGREATTASTRPLMAGTSACCLCCRGADSSLHALDSKGAPPPGFLLVELPERTCDDCSMRDVPSLAYPAKVVGRLIWRYTVGCCVRGESRRTIMVVHKAMLHRMCSATNTARASGNAQASIGGQTILSRQEVDEWMAPFEALPADTLRRADVIERLRTFAFDLHWIVADTISMNAGRVRFLESIYGYAARNSAELVNGYVNAGLGVITYTACVLPPLVTLAALEGTLRLLGSGAMVTLRRVPCVRRNTDAVELEQLWPVHTFQLDRFMWRCAIDRPVPASWHAIRDRERAGTVAQDITPVATPTPLRIEIAQASASFVFGDPLLAYEMPLPELQENGSFKADLGGSTLISRLPYDQRRLDNVISEALRAGKKSVALTIFKNSGEERETLKELVRLKELVPAGFHILPAPKPLYAAAGTFANEVYALMHRHLPQKKNPSRHVQSAFKAIGEGMVFWLKGRLQEKDGNQVLSAAMTSYLSDPVGQFSSKWSPTRKDKALEEAYIATLSLRDRKAKHRPKHAAAALSCAEPEGEYVGLRRALAVKTNELLAKMKPRGILSMGDVGCALHVFGPGFLECILYHLPEVEARSVKHCDGPSLGRRFAKLVLDVEKELKWYLSFDFGAFDASVRLWVRQLIENALLKFVSDLLGTDMSEAAQKDREAWVTKIFSQNDVRVETTDCCRQSGDRGTSVLNYCTNISVNVFCAWRETMLQAGQDWKEEIHTLKDFTVEWLKKGLNGSTRPQTDVIAEGDDNWPSFRKDFVARGARTDAARHFKNRVKGPLTQEELLKASFLHRWVSVAAEAGFALEPQDAAGRVPVPEEGDEPISLEDAKRMAACFSEWCGRHEFVSRLFVPINDGKRDDSWTFAVVPKPRKALDSLTASFRRPSNLQQELKYASEKALSAMANSTGSGLNFAVASALYKATAVDDVEFQSFAETVGAYEAARFERQYGAFTGNWYSEICRRNHALSDDSRERIRARIAQELGVTEEFLKDMQYKFEAMAAWTQDVKPLDRIKSVSEMVALLRQTTG